MGLTYSTFLRTCDRLDIGNITDVNQVISCKTDGTLIGLPSNSSSPTDIYLFEFKLGSVYKGEEIIKGVQKIFISEFNSPIIQHPQTIINSNGIKYEYFIYKMVISQLLHHNINPHFVKFLGGSLDINYNQLLQYLILSTGISNPAQIENNFRRNLIYMLEGLQGRPAITDNNISYAIRNSSRIVQDRSTPNNYKYGFILTEALSIKNINTFVEYTNMPIEDTITFDNLINCIHTPSENTVYMNACVNILFQIATACYALFLSGTSHNDLHAGNILIKKIPERVNLYYIEGKMYKLKTTYTALIFDYDRSYNTGFTNEILNTLSPSFNQTNDLIEQRDFVKIACYALKNFNIAERNYMISILTNDIVTRTLLNDRYNDPSCFLRGRPYTDNPATDFIKPAQYRKINNLPIIIEKIGSHMSKYSDPVTHVYITDSRCFKNHQIDNNSILKIAQTIPI